MFSLSFPPLLILFPSTSLSVGKVEIRIAAYLLLSFHSSVPSFGASFFVMPPPLTTFLLLLLPTFIRPMAAHSSFDRSLGGRDANRRGLRGLEWKEGIPSAISGLERELPYPDCNVENGTLNLPRAPKM